MICLINTECVLAEILELAMLNVAKTFEVPRSKVHVSLNFNEGKLVPNFQVDKEFSGALEQKRAEESIQAIWLESMKPELVTRLKGLKERRYVGRDETAEAAPDPSTQA